MSGAVRIEEEIKNVNDDEESELDSQSKQIAYDCRNRHDQSWEVNLAENACITHKGVGCTSQTGGKV